MDSGTSFEKVVEMLGLTPEQYLRSEQLREWVRLNKDEKYVPSSLLKAWGFEEDDAA